MVFALVAGSTESSGVRHVCYNTNLTARAYLVSLWECTTERRELRDGTAALPQYLSATSSTVRAISSYPLGSIVPVRGDRQHPDTLWRTSGDYEGFGTGVADVQRAFYEVASSFFERPFADVDITAPLIVTGDDFPPVATNDLGASFRMVRAQTLYSHTIRAVKNYVVMIVCPEYIARVLGTAQ